MSYVDTKTTQTQGLLLKDSGLYKYFIAWSYSSEVSGLALHKYQKDGYRHRKVIDTLGLQVQYGYRCRKVTGTVMLQIPNGYRHGKDTGTIKVQVQYSCMYCKDTGAVILQIP